MWPISLHRVHPKMAGARFAIFPKWGVMLCQQFDVYDLLCQKLNMMCLLCHRPWPSKYGTHIDHSELCRQHVFVMSLPELLDRSSFVMSPEVPHITKKLPEPVA